MKIFKTIPLKYIYLTTATIAVVLTVILYKTYAMYNVNTNSGSVLNDQNVKTYNFDINSSQNFIVNANSIYSFHVLVKNTTGYSAHFEIYYASNDDLTDVIIAEVVEDKTITTTALNTSFDLNNNNSKTIPLVIVNNSNTNKNISINIAKGFINNNITYNDNETKIINTYSLIDVTNKCDIIDMNNCIEASNDNGIATFCLKK
ncbi:MAG: hypothetical protein ACI312_00335 [Bacilli bacterium]